MASTELILEAILIVGVSGAAFLSTSVDNLFLLIGFFASPQIRTRQAILGYLSAVVLVLLIGLAAAYAADFVPGRHIGYLGAVPIALGVLGVIRMTRQRGAAPVAQTSVAGGALSVGAGCCVWGALIGCGP